MESLHAGNLTVRLLLVRRMAPIALLLLGLLARSAAAWSVGRATWYESIDHGSCGFGPIGSNSVTGRDVAALADVAADYANSCG